MLRELKKHYLVFDSRRKIFFFLAKRRKNISRVNKTLFII